MPRYIHRPNDQPNGCPLVLVNYPHVFPFSRYTTTVMWTHHTYDEIRQILGETLGIADPPFVWTLKMIQMNDSMSIHVNPLSHFGPEGALINEMSFDWFYCPGKVISITQYDGHPTPSSPWRT